MLKKQVRMRKTSSAADAETTDVPKLKIKFPDVNVKMAGRLNARANSLLNNTVVTINRQKSSFNRDHVRLTTGVNRDLNCTMKHSGFHDFTSDKERSTPPPIVQIMYGTKIEIKRKRIEKDLSDREAFVHSAIRRARMNVEVEESIEEFFERVCEELESDDEEEAAETVKLNNNQDHSCSLDFSKARRRKSISKGTFSPRSGQRNNKKDTHDAKIQKRNSYEGSIHTYRIKSPNYKESAAALFKCHLHNVASPTVEQHTPYVLLGNGPMNNDKHVTVKKLSNARMCTYKLAPRRIRHVGFMTDTVSSRQREMDTG